MDAATAEKPRATPAQRGQLYKFLPLPVIPHHAQWFDAGPVAIALEARVLENFEGSKKERSASVHVFSAGRSEEYLRFDCFQAFPHYHYILNREQHNIIWGYDPDANGDMLSWTLNALRTRLPHFLRRAGEAELAATVERNGFDRSVLDRIPAAIEAWTPPAPHDVLMAEARAWYERWKEIHPQFNTAD